MKKVNRKRRETEKLRTYHSVERRQWVNGLPCAIEGCENRPCDNAHVSPVGDPSGVARKHDYTQIIPLCREHHTEMHTVGEKTFARKYNIDLDMTAQAIEARWQRDSTEWEDLVA